MDEGIILSERGHDRMRKINRHAAEKWCWGIIAAGALVKCISHLLTQDWTRSLIWLCITAAAVLSVRRK